MLDAAALELRLQDALPAADGAAVRALAAELQRAWSEPQRAYHTLQHLEECLQGFDLVRAQLQSPAAVLLALLFHDAVYDPQRHDNEALSAAWAERALAALGADAALTARVDALIMATQSHHVLEHDPAPQDTALLLDIDLSILGSEASRFAEYERQIRQEYGFVPAARYEQGRKKIMQGFAARLPIFQSGFFQDRLEQAAHRNLACFR